MSEDGEDALPEGTQQERDVWYEQEYVPHALDGPSTPSLSLLPSQGRHSVTAPHPSPIAPSPSSPTTLPSQLQPMSVPSSSAMLSHTLHDIPMHVAAQRAREQALVEVKKLLNSQKTHLVSGANGLQAYRVRAIQACLHLMVHEGKGLMDASEVAAMGSLFSGKWGARLVRQWTQMWVKTRILPESQRGRHPKIMSVLTHPTVRAAVRTYLRSEKWSQNPVRLKQMMNNELSTEEAREYRHILESEEMPNGLKDFVMTEILPQYHLKPGRLGLYTCSMVAQAHDGQRWSWLLNGESPLNKKGVGRGLHQSDFICSTVGWLYEASITLEYGKNHEGFWNGELFCQQLTEKFFPAFEKAHGAGHIACILVDNSQGHSVYAPDTLRASKMNLNPGGAQPHMRDGWYLQEGEKVVQQMDFPSDHPVHPNQPKGIKATWLREHCDYSFETLRQNMPKALQSVSVEVIRKWEHRAWRFIDAYAEGLGAREAQQKVKLFSSRRYKSHRRIPEQLARQAKRDGPGEEVYAKYTGDATCP
ncbi:hypothetical protein BD311DRAFT_832187 [Dichomitus squalens]|uniref:DDE-1 domain-containing protein n=1 Tax=Dichomitus squalens TaxID=114155 RepID=A0A4Q9M3E5_9APHY|nr:hypothetical protein BD311DRAFT_832187 [Dichomitus squalens]